MTFRFTVLVFLGTALIVSAAIPSASAQDRFNRRRGALLGGLAGAALGAAIGDKGNNETAGALIGGAVGAVAGGAIGDAKDQRIDHDRQYHQPGYGNPVHNGHGLHGSPGYVYPEHYGHRQYHHGYAVPVNPYPLYRPAPIYEPAPYPSQPILEHAPPPPVLATAPRPSQITPPVANHPITAQPGSIQTVRPLSTLDVTSMVQAGISESMVIAQIRHHGMQQNLRVQDIITLHQQGISEPILQAMQGMSATTSVARPVIDETSTTYGPSVMSPGSDSPRTTAPDFYSPEPNFSAPANAR